MGSRIQTNRVSERFSSHTQATLRRGHKGFPDAAAVREKLIAALVEVVAEGSDPRLAQSRARS